MWISQYYANFSKVLTFLVSGTRFYYLIILFIIKMAKCSNMTTLIFLLYIFHGSGIVKSDKSINSTFIPSHQWKKVKDGQVLPPGLHVRINLHTGEKEAKIPDPETENKKSLIATDQKREEQDKSSTLDPEEIKKLLINIKPDDPAAGDDVKKKFRSYDELKKEFEKLQVRVKSDVEIMNNLIDTFKTLNLRGKNDNNISSDSVKNKKILTVLVDLEYLVHQIDIAQEFARRNGFSEVVYKCLNSSDSEIRAQALLLLGSAAQSNPKVQIAALDSGGINLLLKILTFDEEVTVKSRSLFALSSLIRRFPAAQQKFIKDGGLTAFARIFDEEKKDLWKLQMKIITLIHDLLFERKDTKMNILEEEDRNQTDSKLETLKEKLNQYEKINLEKKLVEQKWCERICEWFLKQNYVKDAIRHANPGVSYESISIEYHTAIVEVVDTLYVLSDICKVQFQSNLDLVDLLFTLKDVYNEAALGASDKKDNALNQFYYNSLNNILKLLTDKLVGNVHKDEL